MQKIILSLAAMSVFLASSAFSAAAPVKPYDYSKCKSYTFAKDYKNRCKSHAKRARVAEKRCTAMTVAAEKEECFKALEAKNTARCEAITEAARKEECFKNLTEKSAKWAADTKNDDGSAGPE